MTLVKNIQTKTEPVIIDRMGIGLFRYDLTNQKFVFVNAALKDILNYDSKSQLTQLTLKDIFKIKGDADLFLKELCAAKAVTLHKIPLKRKDKKPILANLTASLIESSQCIEGIIQDAESYKEIEGRPEFEKTLFENILDNIPDAVYFKDRNNKLIRVNKFYAEGFKMKKEELVGKTDFDFFPQDQAEKMLADDNYVLKTGQSIIGKIEKTLLPNGTWNSVVTTKIPLYGRNRRVVGTMGITRDITAFSNLEEEKVLMSVEAIKVLSSVHQLRDPYTADHETRVSIMAEKISQALKWSNKDILGMKIVGQLHDIGKIAVPAEILSKPGKLTKIEYLVIQQHVQNCYEIVKGIKYPFPLAETIYQHHERLDGSGYPRGIKGKQLIPTARILAVCDVLEAMIYRRPYREALGLSIALDEIKNGMGIKYDKKIVRTVLKLLKKNNGLPFWLD